MGMDADKLEPDQAISSIDQDLLGWRRHVDTLEDAIVNRTSKDSYVIGIKGKWGTGKTTLVNYLRERIEKEHKDKVRILDFNPWLFPDEDHLTNFFDELERLLRGTGRREEANRLAAWNRRLAHIEVLSAFGSTFTNLALKIASAVLFVLSVGAGAILYFNSEHKWLTIPVIVLVLVVVALPKFVKLLIAYFERKQKTGLVSLVKQKQQLGDLLAGMPQKILIIIDDIDRLTPSEICKVFQIVKNNGDLSNLTYLLAFDDDVVTRVLSKEYGEQYEDFTDKIVQLPFTVPYPESVFLEHYVHQRVMQIIESYSKAVQDRWSRSRWINRNHFYFRHIYRTLREVKRILNGFYLDSQTVLGFEIPEVDPVDFFSIELLRVQFSELHGFIRDNKALFTYESDKSTFPLPTPSEDQQSLESYEQALKDMVSQRYRRKIDALLTDIFPKIQAMKHGNTDHSGQETEWSKNLYVCGKDFFDRYFQYGITSDDIPNAVIAAVLRVVYQPKEAVGLLRPYYYKPVLLVGIDRVLSHVGDPQMPSSLFESDWLGFLFEISDYLPQDQGDFLGSTDPVYAVMSQFHSITERLNPEVRANVIESALARSNGVFGPTIVISSLSAVDRTKDDVGQLPEARVDALKDQVSARVQRWLKDDTSLKHQHFVRILLQQKEWIGDTEIRSEIKFLTKEDSNFKMFIARFLTRVEPLSIGAIAGPVGYRYGFGRLCHFMDIREAHVRVSGTRLAEDDSEDTRIAWKVFLADFNDYNSDPNGYARRIPSS